MLLADGSRGHWEIVDRTLHFTTQLLACHEPAQRTIAHLPWQ